MAASMRSSKAWSGTRTLVHAGACQTPMSILVCRLWVGGDGVTVTHRNILAGQLVKHLQALRLAADDCTVPSQRAMQLSRFWETGQPEGTPAVSDG
jgi:hypothetical protein